MEEEAEAGRGCDGTTAVMPWMAGAVGRRGGGGGGGGVGGWTDECDDDEDPGSTGPDVEKASSSSFVDSVVGRGGRLTMVGPGWRPLLLAVSLLLLLFRLPFMMFGVGGREEWIFLLPPVWSLSIIIIRL